MKVLQFVAVQEPRLTARLARPAESLDVVVVLDLEDALWDVDDELRTSALKAEGRRNLLALAATRPDLFERQRIAVRLNRWSSPEAARDLETLASLARLVQLDSLVLTKVESGHDLDAWVAALDRNGVRYRSLVPIVETVAGIAELDAIAGAARRLGIAWIVYGHWDFALESGWWPVPDHDEAEFWEVVDPLIATIERHGIGYVHPPFFHLHDAGRFESVMARLRVACEREFGVITLGRQQTALAGRGPHEHRAAAVAFLERRPEDPDVRASRIVQTVEANRRDGVAFAVDVPRDEFISPHLYLAARSHLARLVRA